MKKSLIAGASVAALGLAVVPFAGVFAADKLTATMTDKLTVTVQPTCLFTQSKTKTTTDWVADAGNEEYTAKLGINEKIDNVGTTNMRVICNDAQGYSVTATSITDLTHQNSTDKIAYNNAAVEAGTSSWSAYRFNATAGTTDPYYISKETGNTNNTVLSSTKPTNSTITDGKIAGDTVDIKYGVATSANQAAGTYTGSITYTLTATSLEK